MTFLQEGMSDDEENDERVEQWQVASHSEDQTTPPFNNSWTG